MSRTLIETLGRFALQAWLPVLLVVAWLLASAGSTSPFWPPLTTSIAALGDWATSGAMWGDAVFSFGNYFIALFAALFVGLSAGVAIGLLPRVGEVLQPYLDFFRTLPIVVFVPIVILVLGVGRGPKIFLIFLACVWPILLNAIEGVRAIAPSVFETSRAFRIPLALSIRRVVIPAAMPHIAIGLRLAVTVGLVMLLVSEMYGAVEGVGYFILESGQRFQLPQTWAGTLFIGVIGWAFTAIYAAAEHRVLAWTREGATTSSALGSRKG
ncbi:MAG: ABC transporter permease [Pseudoclavibacter sp.]